MATDRIAELLIWPEAGGLRAAAIRDGCLDDALLAGDGPEAPGAIHVARVAQLKPEINLGFVTLESSTQVAVNLGASDAATGGLMLVQVAEPATDGKRARATMRVALPGALSVAVIGGRGVVWSRQIPGDRREELGKDLPGMPAQIGLIVRRWAKDAAAGALPDEVRRLTEQAQGLLARARAADDARCLLPADAALAILQEFAPFDPGAILCADPALALRMRHAASGAFAQFKDRIAAVREGEQAADHCDAGGQLARAAETTVALAGGGLMHIERTRALVAVDIDTAGARGGEGVAQTRRAALRELARQLRLRDLTGRIVVDHLAAPGAAETRVREKLFGALKACLRPDRRVVRIAGFTPTGLLEIVRSRGGDDAQ